MTFSVLIVDAELEVLGELASGLRALGLDVTIADSPTLALERARTRRPDALVIERSFARHTDLLEQLAADRQLATIPRLLMTDAPSGDALLDGALPNGALPNGGLPNNTLPREPLLDRRDCAALARSLYELPRKRAAAREGDFRGDLTQLGVVDLLQLLSMNRRSGALTISTARGAGEVRLREGEIVDAVFRRQEGEKALFRLLAEQEGSFAFASGNETALRRIEVPTSALLLEGVRQIDEVRRLREQLGGSEAALTTHADLPDGAAPLELEIFATLETPKSLDDLLEELGESDLRILQVTHRLLERGHLRRLSEGATRAELTEPDRQHLLAALLRRLSREGFGGTARLVFAGDARRLAALAHAAGRLAEAEVPAQSLPLAPVPHSFATLKLPENARLELVALPLLEEFGPLWGLSLPGSAAVVQLDGPGSPLLEQLTKVLGIPLLCAATLLGEMDEGDSQQVAALIRGALDQLVSA